MSPVLLTELMQPSVAVSGIHARGHLHQRPLQCLAHAGGLSYLHPHFLPTSHAAWWTAAGARVVLLPTKTLAHGAGVPGAVDVALRIAARERTASDVPFSPKYGTPMISSLFS